MQQKFMVISLALLFLWQIPSVFAAEIHHAAGGGNLTKLNELLATNPQLVLEPDETGNTPLHFAAGSGSVPAVQLLVDHGADLTATNNQGDTPLHWAASEGNVEVIRYLLEQGAVVDPLNHQDQTPLHYAAVRGQAEACLALLDAGAEIDKQDIEGCHALGYAVTGIQPSVIQLLIEQGADIELANDYKRTPLILVARDTGDVASAQILLRAGANVNARDCFGSSSLSLSAWRGFDGLVNTLLDAGAVIDLDTEGGEMCFFAVEKGLDRLFFYLMQLGRQAGLEQPLPPSTLIQAAIGGSPAITGALLEQGIDPNTVDEYGWTSLLWATRRNRQACVKQLLNAGADINSRNRLGQSAYNLALDWDHPQMAKLLEDQGADTSAQQFPKLTGPYLGQAPPGLVPRRFALGVVDSAQMEHTCVSFAPDFSAAAWPGFFMFSESGYSTGKVLVSQRAGDTWGAPCMAPFNAGNDYSDNDPCFAPDGSGLYFYSCRTQEPGAQPTKENIWFVKRTAEGWGEAQCLSQQANSLQDMHWQVSVDLAGNIYCGAVDSRGHGGSDIYCIRHVNDEYLPPENIGGAVNSEADESTPYITPDGQVLLFSRCDTTRGQRQIDIYFSQRQADGSWSAPVNLGRPINTGERELCPSLTPDGKYLFYLGSGEEGEGMYWVSVEACPALAGALAQS